MPLELHVGVLGHDGNLSLEPFFELVRLVAVEIVGVTNFPQVERQRCGDLLPGTVGHRILQLLRALRRIKQPRRQTDVINQLPIGFA